MRVREILAECFEVHVSEIGLHEIARNRDIALAIYHRRGSVPRQDFIGERGRAYEVLGVTMLIRHGRDGVASKRRADELYKALEGLRITDGFVRLKYAEPVWLGADGRGVFEWVVDFDFVTAT